MPLVDQADEGPPHGDDVIVGVRRHDEHLLGEGRVAHSARRLPLCRPASAACIPRRLQPQPQLNTLPQGPLMYFQPPSG